MVLNAGHAPAIKALIKSDSDKRPDLLINFGKSVTWASMLKALKSSLKISATMLYFLLSNKLFLDFDSTS